ncbi:MAG: hypothetical protein A2946_02770 [Candidatus Liptonbacteria bacterium RIFCSPLOWO2_01_FULL_53_13]|uniref:Uncharacterized protein n=1 Tax=Candidatus Liptonbacteria bacterium RIFCSPLOWO2_01_FULL_53_13 TaxID=1798651 RepID=A0A1G2CNW9_9BACT|nr:MAG: hypothetical protein A2946_02770 [Candidatus Liptonbacteria bacterium RIFCSPLOWO2_01_FULL_53_13]
MKLFHRLKTWYAHIKKYALLHKTTAVIVALVIIGGGYYGYKKLTTAPAETRYVLAAAEKGTLVVSVAGTGQVSASNQVDLKPKVSGDVTAIGVSEGQRVTAGTLIVRLDSRDAEKTVRDAEANLESAKISLQKLVQPADALSLLQAENTLAQAKESEQNAESSLMKAYDDGFTAIANAFIDIPGVMTGLESVLNGNTLAASQSNAYAYYDLIKLQEPSAEQFRDTALASYATARTAYEKTLQNYKNTSRYSDKATVDSLISESYDTMKSISEAIKNAKSFLDFVNDTLAVGGSRIPSALTTHIGNLQSYTGTANTHIGALLNIKTSIQDDKDTIVGTERTIREKTEALLNLKAGADPLDVKSQDLSITQRENALRDAKETLANYFIRAPFDGIVAAINVRKGDSASGASAVATVITAQKIAEVSLNEVDVAKINAGQKVTLTFDAFPDLTIAGSVVQVDTIGTATQGVVNYGVKIAFDTQDDRVRPAMSVSAAIITSATTDALLVPNGAVKSDGSAYYVEMLEGVDAVAATSAMGSQGIASNTAPRRQTVEIGEANDTITAILGGLKEGDLVVSRTISGTATTASPSTQNTSVRLPGISGGR